MFAAAVVLLRLTLHVSYRVRGLFESGSRAGPAASYVRWRRAQACLLSERFIGLLFFEFDVVNGFNCNSEPYSEAEFISTREAGKPQHAS